MSEKSQLPKNDEKYIFLNTASETAVISLRQGTAVILEENLPSRPDLSKNLSPKLDEILKKTKTKKEEIKGFLVFPGPGSFTGLRIGISFANSFSYALGIPLYTTDEKGKIKEGPLSTVIPFYGSAPKITKPKKH